MSSEGDPNGVVAAGSSVDQGLDIQSLGDFVW